MCWRARVAAESAYLFLGFKLAELRDVGANRGLADFDFEEGGHVLVLEYASVAERHVALRRRRHEAALRPADAALPVALEELAAQRHVCGAGVAQPHTRTHARTRTHADICMKGKWHLPAVPR